MEAIIEDLAGYAIGLLILLSVIYYYLRNNKKKSDQIAKKIERARELGFYEPVSLHPVIDPDVCIGSGACVAALKRIFLELSMEKERLLMPQGASDMAHVFMLVLFRQLLCA